jgi:hypothetical protein
VSLGFFPVASDSSMCPGVDSASENEYQVNPGGKGGRCVTLTTYHLHVPMSRILGALTSWNPVGLFRPVMGKLLVLAVQHISLALLHISVYRRIVGVSSIVCHVLHFSVFRGDALFGNCAGYNLQTVRNRQ